MDRRSDFGSEQNSLSFVLALAYGILLAAVAIGVSLNVVEVGLSVWEIIPWRR
jgi:hypothetical protein